MIKHKVIQRTVLSVLIATSLLSIGIAQKKQSEKPPSIRDSLSVSLLSSPSTVCWSNNLCDFGNSTTRLYASATNLKNDELVFEWTVSAGKVSAEGPSVTWDLKNAGWGPQTAKVKVKDKQGREGNAEIKISVVECGACDDPPPPCPEIAIYAAERSTNIKHLAFIVKIEGAQLYQAPSFDWTTNLGKIINGQNTSEVKIDASGFVGEELTVTVSVGGFDPSCQTTASKQFVVKN